MARRTGSLRAVSGAGAEPSWAQVSERFLRRDLAAGTRRVYRLTLIAVEARLDLGVPLSELSSDALETAVQEAFGSSAPATWNRVVATVRSFVSYAASHGYLDGQLATTLPRRREVVDHARALGRTELDGLFARRDVPLRERCLWRLLFETAAQAQEVLCLNVEDIDLANRRALTVRKGGDRDVLHFQTGSARLLPKLIAGRTRGPLFLADRPPAAGRVPARSDLCPTTGRARLSYRRAAELFKGFSGGATLHQLRHSAITGLAEAGVPLPLLMAKSRHASLRTLQRYARPSVDAVAALTAAHDPARRRR